MKILAFAFFLLLTPIFGYSQAYSLICNSWNTIERDCSFSPEHTDTTSLTHFLRVNSDTTINSYPFFKLEESYDSTGVNWAFIGCIKFDTLGDIYFRTPDETEYLMYSFNLNKFDTLLLWGYDAFPQLSAYVYDKDSVLIDNVYRDRFYINYLESLHSEIWIEGIGSQSGFIRHYEDHLLGNYMERELLCCHQDTQLVYHNQEYASCTFYDQNTSGTELPDIQHTWKIFPNPFTGSFTISSDIFIDRTALHLYDLFGRCIYNGIASGREFSIELPDLQKGIYLLRLENSNQSIKLMKE